jgi:hypothetical protein
MSLLELEDRNLLDYRAGRHGSGGGADAQLPHHRSQRRAMDQQVTSYRSNRLCL